MISLPENWHPKAPASDAIIEQLISDSRAQLPEAYQDLLRVSNGGYAELSVPSWTIDVWATEEVIRLNHEYSVDVDAPNFLAFGVIGSNLGEELLAFDKREGTRSGVYMLSSHAPSETDVFKLVETLERLVTAIEV